MKTAYLLLIAGLALFSCTNDDQHAHNAALESTRASSIDPLNDSANFTTMEWIDSMHQDFGKINEGQVLEISWRFRNTGNKPLVIANVMPGCGCTLAEKPEAPIAPGQEGVIRAKFDSKGRLGAQRKDVTVLSNIPDNRTHLSFGVEVQK